MTTVEEKKNWIRQEIKNIESDLVSLDTSIRNANDRGDYKWVHKELLPIRDDLYKKLAEEQKKFGDLCSSGGKK